MKRIIAAILTVLTVAGCALPEPTKTTWQITNVYSDANTPSQLPEPAYLVLGNTSVTGSTGCGQFQGRVKISPNVDNPTSIEFRDMNFEPARCEGAQRYFHDQLVPMLQGIVEVKKEHGEMLLTKPTEFDRPGVRLIIAQ